MQGSGAAEIPCLPRLLKRPRLERFMLWGLKVWEARNSDSRPPRTAPGSCITAASFILTLPLEPAQAANGGSSA